MQQFDYDSKPVLELRGARESPPPNAIFSPPNRWEKNRRQGAGLQPPIRRL